MSDERSESGLRIAYTHSTREFWEQVEVGLSLGDYEYPLDATVLQNYRTVVGDADALYPTVAARHGQRLFESFFTRRPGLTNAGIEARYVRPPQPGTIRVQGRIADKYERRGKLYLVIEAQAFDSESDADPFEVTRLIGLLQAMSEMTDDE